MNKITFYTHPMSRGRVVRWMLEETGLPYETVLLDYCTTMKAPEYLAVNPMGKVPAITHGGTVVTETAAVCLYLADLVPEKKLAPPAGSFDRGSYYRWISFMAPLEQLMSATAGVRHTAAPRKSIMPCWPGKNPRFRPCRNHPPCFELCGACRA